VVLVTAALDVYATAVADHLGLDGVVSPTVEIVDGRCTGRIIDADLNGQTKVEALKAWLGDREPDAVVYAYGNSNEDDELLAYAASTHRRTAGASASSSE
jgi:phosphoserine phosphatase